MAEGHGAGGSVSIYSGGTFQGDVSGSIRIQTSNSEGQRHRNVIDSGDLNISTG